MAIDNRYIVDTTLQPHFINKATGESLANGAVYFYKDNDRNTLKPVYMLTGSPPNYTYSALPNPLSLNSVGLPQDDAENQVAFYYFPYDAMGNVENYYVAVYAEGDSPGNGDPQLTREGWPNIEEIEASTTVSVSNTQNVLSNSQFVDVLFDPNVNLTINFTGNSETVVTIAPYWDLYIDHSSAGSCTIVRTAIAGSQDIPTQPAYTIRVIGSANIERLELRQRLTNNSGIWSMIPGDANGYLAASITTATGSQIDMLYRDNLGNQQTILTSNNTSGLYQEYTNTVQLATSANTTTSTTGYVDIVVSLEPTGVNTFTSVQVVGLATEENNISYYQESANRQRDNLFGYYNPLLQQKCIPSYLVGWDFPTNPAQFTGDTVAASAIGANKSKYVWDQTIVFQSTDSGIAVSRAPTGALRLTADLASEVAVIQYIEASVAREILNDRFSVHVTAKTSNTPNIGCSVAFYYTTDATLPDVANGTNNSLVLTMDGFGRAATFNGNWTEVTREYYGDGDIDIEPSSTNNFNDYSVSGFTMAGATASNNATYAAIVIGFEQLPQNETIDIHSVALCAGDIATRPAPQSKEAVLAECERYYEKSFAQDDYAGDTTTVNQVVAVQSSYNDGATNFFFQNSGFSFSYRTPKYSTAPDLTIYNPAAGTANSIQAFIFDPGTPVTNSAAATFTTNWTTVSASDKSASFAVNASLNLPVGGGGFASASQGSGWITYHYVVDSRLGIV